MIDKKKLDLVKWIRNSYYQPYTTGWGLYFRFDMDS